MHTGSRNRHPGPGCLIIAWDQTQTPSGTAPWLSAGVQEQQGRQSNHRGKEQCRWHGEESRGRSWRQKQTQGDTGST